MPADYMLFEEKVKWYKTHKEFVPPASWRANSRGVELPSDALLEVLVAERPSVAPLRPEQEQDFEYGHGGENCPAGQAYSEVVVVEVNPNSELYKKGKVTVVIFRKEQILNRNESQVRPSIGWPTGAIRISPVGVPGSLEPQVAGVWATLDDEMAHLNAAEQCGTINEESPGTAAQSAAPASAVPDAPATYAASMPPEPPLPTVPTILQQPTLQQPS